MIITPDTKHKKCEHQGATPLWNADAAAGMNSHQIRVAFPRFEGRCPDCGEQIIVYATMEQYVGGDY